MHGLPKDGSKAPQSNCKILIAVDDSDALPLILEFVSSHRWQPGTVFEVIYVISSILLDHPMAAYPLFLETIEKDMKKQAEDLLLRVMLELGKTLPDHKVLATIREGQPAETIIEEAENVGAKMIVIGSHGRTGFKRFLLGSVSGAVVSHAPCDVMIVRIPKPVKEVQEEKQQAALQT